MTPKTQGGGTRCVMTMGGPSADPRRDSCYYKCGRPAKYISKNGKPFCGIHARAVKVFEARIERRKELESK